MYDAHYSDRIQKIERRGEIGRGTPKFPVMKNFVRW